MATLPQPNSPPAPDSSTFSDTSSFIHSLDALSLSAGSDSFDLVSNPSHPSAPSSFAHPSSGVPSEHSGSSHSRHTSFSGSIISGPGSYADQHEQRRLSSGEAFSEEDEVILLLRSLASSVTGASLGRASRSGTPGSSSRGGNGAREEVVAVKEEEAPGPSPPLSSSAGRTDPAIGLTDTEVRKLEYNTMRKAKTFVKRQRQKAAYRSLADGGSGDIVHAPSFKEEVQEQYERFMREKTRRKLKEKAGEEAAAAASGGSQGGSQVESGSYSGLSSDDLVKVEKGAWKGKNASRGGSAARRRRRRENRDLGAVEDVLGPGGASTPKKGQSTTYDISGTPRVINRSALDLLTGNRGPATPSTQAATPKLQQASLQKLHLLDLLNNGSSTSGSSAGSRDDEEEDDSDGDDDGDGAAEDEADDVLTDLGTPEVYGDVRGETPISSRSSGSSAQRRRRAEGSIMSADDARSSIDDFMINPSQRLTREETLRFWQSLCFELGLANLDDEEPYLPDLPTGSAPSTSSTASNSTSASSSRSTTPTQNARPMPQTLFTAKALLKAEGHVNIADYFDARKADQEAAASAKADAEGGKQEEELDRDAAGRYAHLVQPNSTLMKRYTKSSGRFVQLDWVKAEAMQPLLRDFGFKQARQRRG